MPVTDLNHDIDARTVSIVADFAAPPERVWQIYADPGQLAKVLGPLEYPATVHDHDLRPGGRVTYVMTGPDDDSFAGLWSITAVQEPHGFDFEEAFADATFAPDPDLPVSRTVYRFAPHDGGTRATYLSTYATAEALQQALDMGVPEGTREGISQIDALLGPAAGG